MHSAGAQLLTHGVGNDDSVALPEYHDPWFNNNIGRRLDVGEFTLPSACADDAIASFMITQVTQGANGDAALFLGLTLSSAPANLGGVPEAATPSLFALGLHETSPGALSARAAALTGLSAGVSLVRRAHTDGLGK